MELLQSLDYQILFFLQERLRSPVLTPVMLFFTALGDSGAVWLALAAACLFRRSTRACGAAMLLALLLGLLTGNLILKNLFARPRPFLTYSSLHHLVAQGGYSFPSAHAMSSFAAAGSFFLFFRQHGRTVFGVPALVLAALIAFSRLYVGVHYPSDVLCGCLIGLALAYAAVHIIPCVFHLNHSGDSQHEEE